jgi:hypothetical protein
MVLSGASNGDQVSRIAALAMKRGKSVDFLPTTNLPLLLAERNYFLPGITR